MPLAFRILGEHNLVYVSCTGYVTVSETLEAFQAYADHDDFRPGQSQLIDLSDVTGYERDFTNIMSLQAQQADVYLLSDAPIHLIFVATNKLTRSMAMASLRSWEDVTGVVPLVLSSIEEAETVLSLDKHALSKATVLV